MTKKSFAVLMGLWACLAWQAVAQAQTYTFKELKQPTDANNCASYSGSHHVVGDNGDVAITCQYYSGFDWTIFQASYSMRRTSVWRSSGAVQRLNPPSGYAANEPLGMDRSGNLLSYRVKMSGTIDTPLDWWRGTTRSAFVVPAGFTGNWRAVALNASGKVLAFKKGGSVSATVKGALAIFNGSSGQALPLPSGGAKQYSFEDGLYAVLNDAGQVALLERAINQVEPGDARFWNGGTWITIPRSAQGAVLQPVDINIRGEVLLFDERLGKAYLWSEAAGLSELPLNLPNTPRLGLADNGNVAGTQLINGVSQVVVLVNGQALDLNVQAKMPTGVKLAWVEDVNAKGQVLAVSMVSGSTKLRYWLLTPK